MARSTKCRFCGKLINFRQMEAGQWVPFEGYDTVHECGKVQATRTKKSPPIPSSRPTRKSSERTIGRGSSISVESSKGYTSPETRPAAISSPQKIAVSAVQSPARDTTSPSIPASPSPISPQPGIPSTSGPQKESQSGGAGCLWVIGLLCLLFFFLSPQASRPSVKIVQSLNDKKNSYFVLEDGRIFEVENPGLILEMAPGTPIEIATSNSFMTPRSGKLKGERMSARLLPALPECEAEVFLGTDGEPRYRITKSQFNKMVEENGLPVSR